MTPIQATSVLLVDQDFFFCQGIKTLLKFYSGPSRQFHVIGETHSVDQALHLISQYQPDLMLLDLELPEGNGIAILDDIKKSGQQLRSLVISNHQEDEWIFRVMQSGASGYIFKEELADHLYKAIVTVLNKEVYLPSAVATRFFRQFSAYADEFSTFRPVTCLTDREYEVLQYLIEGYSNQAIAKHLFITTATVKAHLTAIYSKLGVTSRAQAIVAALKLGVVSLNLSHLNSVELSLIP